MSDTFTVEDCRSLLKSTTEWAMGEQELASIDNTCKMLTKVFSPRERFDVAKQLLPELEAYPDWYDNAPILPVGQRNSITALLGSFQECDEISRKEFISLLDEAGIFIVELIARNPSFPIDVLMEDTFFHRHLLDPKYSQLALTVRYIKARRIKEVVTYSRDIIPGSEHMADDMVLAISGANMY